MANNKRLLGQSTFFKLIRDGAVANTFNAVVDFTFTDNLEVLDEGFIGETTNRKDSVYNGTDFSMTAVRCCASIISTPDQSAISFISFQIHILN